MRGEGTSAPLIREKLSCVLVAALKHAGLTRYEAAKRSGIAPANLRRYVSGKSSPSLGNLLLLGDALGIPAWKLLRHAQRQIQSSDSP